MRLDYLVGNQQSQKQSISIQWLCLLKQREFHKRVKYHSGAEGATKYFPILCFFGFKGKFKA